VVEGLAVKGYVRPTLRRGRIDGRCQGNSKRRMGTGNPIEDLPGSSILELDVEDRNFDLAVAKPAHGVIDADGPEYGVVASLESFLKGVANNRVVFSDEDPHKTVVRVFRPPGK
jgi:hypothetical protein